MAKRSAIAVYAAGFLQGSAFVLIPALGSILAAAPYHLSSSVYGLLYLPQAVGAIIGALSAGFLQKRIGSHGIFRLGVEANLVALILLVGVAHTGATLALSSRAWMPTMSASRAASRSRRGPPPPIRIGGWGSWTGWGSPASSVTW